MAWFNEKSPPELIDEVKKMNEAILMADERMVLLSGDEDAIDAYERRQKALFDETNRINSALREGMEKGMAEKTLEVAQKMKKMGLPITQITETTGLSSEVVESMRK
jgi:predicted transposase/invertase (TIGR01784 family)